MNGDIKQKAISGLFWKYAERILAQLVSTVVAIILARLLEPEHYGIIGIVNIFITLCNVFVVTGLGESLIQKKDADELDFSSMFYVNLSLSIVLYLLLFFSAPVISLFYENKYPEIVPLIRVMGLRLIVASINSIQSAKVSRDMSFKKYFWVTLIGTAVSAIVGISMAYNGFGVWALAAQYMTNTTVDTIMLFVFIDWHPKLMFSFKRVKPLFKYGWKVLATALAGAVYNEMRGLIIGKKYSSEDLAFYNKGGTYPKLIVNNLNSAISSVIFPLFAFSQDDKPRVKSMMRKAMKTSSYLVFPAMVGLAVVASSFVEVLLTPKWLPCVPYLQMMCVIYAFNPVFGFNLQCLTALGHSAEYLKIMIFEYLIGLIILVLTFRYGVIWIALGQVFSTVINCCIDAVVGGRKVDYSLMEQIKDILPNFLTALCMGAVVVIIKRLAPVGHTAIILVLQVAVGGIVYLALSVVMRNESFLYLFGFARSIVRKEKEESHE